MYNGIVISGLPGSGKSTLAKRLSEILGWQVYSIGGLFRREWKRLYPNNEITFEQFWRNVNTEKQLEMNERARKIIGKGNAVGDFRYVICCKNLPVLKIFVTAELETRASRANYNGKSIHEKKIILNEREKDEITVGKRLYGDDYDYRNKKDYDLILDSGIISVDDEVNLVLNTLKIKTKQL